MATDENNVDKVRTDMLRTRDAEISMHSLKRVDEKFFFIYDETNNFRKLYIRDGTFNVQKIGNFVLGGIAFLETKKELPIPKLRVAMKIDKGVKDLKLKHVGGTGTFFELIQMRKMAPLLEWFIENELIIHFSNIEPFYWSIVDIIDSILADSEDDWIPFVYILKADLAECLSNDVNLTLKVFERFRYPSIAAEQRSEFIEVLIELVLRNRQVLEDENFFMLLQFLNQGFSLRSLPFIDQTPSDIPGMLIEKFGHFYRQRMILFKNSVHLFDEEGEIKSFFENDSILAAFPEINFDFCASENELAIQISDMMMGLLGKLFTQMRSLKPNEVETQYSALSVLGKNNLKLLSYIYSYSNDVSSALQHHVASLYDRKKTELLFELSK